MAGTIEFLQNAIKLGKKDWETKFPAIEDVMVVHNTALAAICPMYMQQYIDKDKSAFYLLARCNPLKGDCSRQMACAWLEDLFYEKCGCPSSYDVEAGGTMSRKVAISKELLPADNDAEYMDYYQEQMAKLKEMFSAKQKAAKKQEFIDKNGFDPDDPDIIDVAPIGEEPQALPGEGTTAVEQSAGTEIGMPKPLFYGAVFHANGFGMKLGYDKKVWTLSHGNTTIDQLGFDDANSQLTEKEEEEMIKEGSTNGTFDPEIAGPKLLKMMLKVGYDSALALALGDVYEKFFGQVPTEATAEQIVADCEKKRDEMRAAGELNEDTNYYSSFAQIYSALKGIEKAIKDAHANIPSGVAESVLAECDAIKNECDKCGDPTCKDGEKCGLKEDEEIEDLSEDDMQAEIEKILEDDKSDTEKELDEYSKIEDESDEDDDELSESVIRHATMLAKEIW